MWLKVTLHIGSHSGWRRKGGARQEKWTARIAEEGEGQPVGQAVHGIVQSSVFCFGHDWGSLEGHIGLQNV